MMSGVLEDQIKQVAYECVEQIREKLVQISIDEGQWVNATVSMSFTGIGKKRRPEDHVTIKVDLNTEAKTKAFGVSVGR